MDYKQKGASRKQKKHHIPIPDAPIHDPYASGAGQNWTGNGGRRETGVRCVDFVRIHDSKMNARFQIAVIQNFRS